MWMYIVILAGVCWEHDCQIVSAYSWPLARNTCIMHNAHLIFWYYSCLRNFPPWLEDALSFIFNNATTHSICMHTANYSLCIYMEVYSIRYFCLHAFVLDVSRLSLPRLFRFDFLNVLMVLNCIYSMMISIFVYVVDVSLIVVSC